MQLWTCARRHWHQLAIIHQVHMDIPWRVVTKFVFYDHASIRLESVFFHDLTRDKRRWSSTLPNSEILTCDVALLRSTYTRVTATSQCKSTWQMTSADNVTQQLLATDVVRRCQKCKCAFTAKIAEILFWTTQPRSVHHQTKVSEHFIVCQCHWNMHYAD
jgi:hypothetical protein